MQRARSAVMGLLWACLAASPALAHEAVHLGDETTATRLPDVRVVGEAYRPGQPMMASTGSADASVLASRPRHRTGEVLELVPGLIATQHAGGGKANQYFLRGWNLDHGTDFATWLDGIPLNLVSHGHGQGYTDLNLVIPELLQAVQWSKGTGAAEDGDFASAGSVRLQTADAVAKPFVQLEAGMLGYGRLVAAASPHVGGAHLLIGGELLHHDGPWQQPEDYLRGNLLVRLSRSSRALRWALTARSHAGDWRSTDQVAQSAVQTGLISRWGSLDPDTGGNTQRHLLSADVQAVRGRWKTSATLWGGWYDLRLVSNFTWYAGDPLRGDEFVQLDRRWQAGGQWQLERRLRGPAGLAGQWRLGLQLRGDRIDNALLQTVAGRVTDKEVDGMPLPGVTRQDAIGQGAVGIWTDWTQRWPGRLRSTLGLRLDGHSADVRAHQPINTRAVGAALVSPKLMLAWLAGWGVELYAQAGLGYHSNDARGAALRRDPVTVLAVQPANLLVPSQGAEAGVRWQPSEHLQLGAALWWLGLDSELLFVGDAGTTEASRPSRRVGVEASVRLQPTPRWLLDADWALSDAAFADNPPGEDGAPLGQFIPGAARTVVSAGVLHQFGHGLEAAVRLRYFGPRPLVEDNSLRSDATALVSAQLRWAPSAAWSLTATVLNALARDDADITYAYDSRVTPLAPLQTERHFHPVEPLQARLSLRVGW